MSVESFVRKNEAGDIEHVAVVEGANIVLARVYAGNVPGLVENAQNRGDVAGSGSGSAGGVGSKSTVAELDEYASDHEVPEYPVDGTKSEKLAAIKAADEGEEG